MGNWLSIFQINLSNFSFTSIGTTEWISIIVAGIVVVILLWRMGLFEGMGDNILAYIFRDKSEVAASRKELKRWFGEREGENVGKWFDNGKE